MRCHNMEFFYARHQGAKKSPTVLFQLPDATGFGGKGEVWREGVGSFMFKPNHIHSEDNVAKAKFGWSNWYGR